MRDHNYIDERGNRIPVSQMALSDIQDILAKGTVTIDNADGYTAPVESVLERLRIELVIRSLGL